MIKLSDIGLLYVRELRAALRERNIVINSILVPLFMYPLILWVLYTGISFVSGQTEGMASRVMIKDLPEQHATLKNLLAGDKQIELKSEADAAAAIARGSLDLLVEFLPPESPAMPQNFRARMSYDKSKDRSERALERVNEHLARYRERYLESFARERGILPDQLQQFQIEQANVATQRQMGQFILGMILPLFLIIMITIGGLYPAIDCTAGEREKSTWETLMTTATGRENIIIAKYLYVATMSCLAGMLNLVAMMASLKSVLAPLLGTRAAGMTFQIPLSSIPVILLGAALMALFTSAGMMILASFARTFKDGQSMVSPFYILSFLPAMFLQAPGIEFTPTLAAIPVANIAMMFREAISGVYHWPLIAITVVVEALCIVGALWLAVTILKYEDFILGSYDGSLAKFLKERVFGKKLAGGKA